MGAMSPQLAAGLTAFVGICLLAGWATGFRHRSYVGWLGLAFVVLAGFLLALGRLREAQALGGSDPLMKGLVRGLLVVWVAALVLAAWSAVTETARRLEELRAGHQEAAEALLEMVRATEEPEKPAGEAEPAPESKPEVSEAPEGEGPSGGGPA
jgi:hypothetical protein